MRRCGRCGSIGNVHEHHIAPVKYFGKEADDWPKVFLCEDCHTQLHATIDGGVGVEVDSDNFYDKLFGVGVVREPTPCVVIES